MLVSSWAFAPLWVIEWSFIFLTVCPLSSHVYSLKPHSWKRLQFIFGSMNERLCLVHFGSPQMIATSTTVSRWIIILYYLRRKELRSQWSTHPIFNLYLPSLCSSWAHICPWSKATTSGFGFWLPRLSKWLDATKILVDWRFPLKPLVCFLLSSVLGCLRQISCKRALFIYLLFIGYHRWRLSDNNKPSPFLVAFWSWKHSKSIKGWIVTLRA